jgi:hypothetical protein
MDYLWEITILLGTWGASLLFCRERRKFNRQNRHGIEHFISFSSKLKSEFVDAFLQIIGISSIIIGLLMIMLFDTSAASWVALVTLIAIFGHLSKKIKMCEK